jgi:hypothetical protein
MQQRAVHQPGTPAPVERSDEAGPAPVREVGALVEVEVEAAAGAVGWGVAQAVRDSPALAQIAPLIAELRQHRRSLPDGETSIGGVRERRGEVGPPRSQVLLVECMRELVRQDRLGLPPTDAGVRDQVDAVLDPHVHRGDLRRLVHGPLPRKVSQQAEQDRQLLGDPRLGAEPSRTRAIGRRERAHGERRPSPFDPLEPRLSHDAGLGHALEAQAADGRQPAGHLEHHRIYGWAFAPRLVAACQRDGQRQRERERATSTSS